MEIKLKKTNLALIITLVLLAQLFGQELKINDKDYFERQGLNVIVLHDIYPEGRQGGMTIIQHGKRVAANGNLSLQPTPGQWQPYPKFLNREVLKDENKIVATLMFPDSNRINAPNQPIIYPDFEFQYNLNVLSVEGGIKVSIDLDEPLPKEWEGKVSFSIELFPGYLFGRSYWMDNSPGIFPRYANTPVVPDEDGEFEAVPMATGKKLVIVPEDSMQMMTIENQTGSLELLDGRVKHNNGWFVVRSLVLSNKTTDAIEWLIKPNVVDEWIYKPVVHTSQVGYHPGQEKLAIIELDAKDESINKIEVKKINPDGVMKSVLILDAGVKERFLRYDYLTADFTSVKEAGMYMVQYGESVSNPFKISNNVYQQGVWQPTLEYFLPVQMCHMKIFEKYRVWHDRCHLDDALMAPEDIRHFDGYRHGKVPEGFLPFQHIDDLDKGGWHDAGDYDFRIESQINTVLTLALAYEEFGLDHDQTLINQEEQHVEIHHPDGKPDALQQIEHGLLTVLGGYRQFGKLYRGVICPTLRQYAMLGDAGSMTDNEVFEGKVKGVYTESWYDQVSNQYDKYFSPQTNHKVKREFVPDLDDRFVFLEDNPGRQIQAIAGLAAASRVLKGYNDALAVEALKTAEELWQKFGTLELKRRNYVKIQALAELILTTDKSEYKKELVKLQEMIVKSSYYSVWVLGRIMTQIEEQGFQDAISGEINNVKLKIDSLASENPFGIPYHPHIWGAGWGIQRFGLTHYFLYKGWPDVFEKEPTLNALNFVLGCHPGENTASFVSNVGSKSQIIAYGINRGDWSFIPGGVVSGTNLVRPDYPEMKDWPFLWQQTEYVMGGGATHLMFLVLAADKILNK